MKGTFIDLFCGAGGLSAGFSAAGFEELLCIDHAEAAVATHRANFASQALRADIDPSTLLPQADVIVGGPPCQGFSSAGLRRSEDRRNSLVSVFSQLIAANRPQAFVFENVEGFLTAEGGRRVLELLDPLIQAGYRIHLRKVNAANFGVPQHRKRVLAVGGLGWDPSFPKATHRAFGAPGAHRAWQHLPQCPTLNEALAGLPAPSLSPPGEPPGHYSRPLNDADEHRVRLLQPGQTMRDLPPELRHESYARRANRRVRDGMPTEKRGGAPAGLRRLRGDEPCKAITGGARTEFVHPVENRYLTIRECARIQTFDDSFVFCGTAAEQMQMIGNAVPPRFARLVGEAVLRGLHRSAGKEEQRPGALLSCLLTSSSGMSPALQQTQRMILDRYGSLAAVEELPLWR